ncbi:hypothetical protein BJV82DRAFT_590629 [Fennellomyces sp. T-0311]|nr:hypothetical protein BJV82DRAFT_590629 [Fennellomyces sp. T-0311]
MRVGFANRGKYTLEIAQKAYTSGVRKIVHCSSISAGFPWRTSLVGEVHRASEAGIMSIPNRGGYVTLRPAHFMSNHLGLEMETIKASNTIVDVVDPEAVQQWISTNDIDLPAANILQEPIEKHADSVYEMIGDIVSCTDRAKPVGHALGRKIIYVKAKPEELYNNMIKAGFPHALAYEFTTEATMPEKISPGLSVLLKRQPETLAQWLEANKAALIEAATLE